MSDKRNQRFAPKGTPGWTGPRELGPLIDRIFERHPGARDFEPCECGVTLAIIPRRMVRPYTNPDQGGHFVVEDESLRREVSYIIELYGLPNANYEGVDAVLVLAERA